MAHMKCIEFIEFIWLCSAVFVTISELNFEYKQKLSHIEQERLISKS